MSSLVCFHDFSDGRLDRRMDGPSDRPTDGRMVGWSDFDGRRDGWSDGRTVGRTVRWTGGQTGARTETFKRCLNYSPDERACLAHICMCFCCICCLSWPPWIHVLGFLHGWIRGAKKSAGATKTHAERITCMRAWCATSDRQWHHGQVSQSLVLFSSHARACSAFWEANIL